MEILTMTTECMKCLTGWEKEKGTDSGNYKIIIFKSIFSNIKYMVYKPLGK